MGTGERDPLLTSLERWESLYVGLSNVVERVLAKRLNNFLRYRVMI